MAKALGRGLGALLPGAPLRESQAPPVVELPQASLRPNPYQPRQEMDQEALEGLVRSLESHGLLEPILVRPCEGGYEIVAGERRWQAAKLAGLERVPVRVLDLDDEAVLEVALIENLQREDLAPLEVARALAALMERGEGQEAVARTLGWSRSTVANKLRLLNLPQEVQLMLARRELTEGHGRTLLALDDEVALVALAERCRDEGWSVRDLEEALRQALTKGEAPPPRRPAPQEIALSPEAKRLKERFGISLRVAGRGKKRSLRIGGLGESEVEALLELLDREGERLFPGK